MAVTQLPDGRWICYYRVQGKLKKEYFGRGPEAEAEARKRHDELNLKPRRPAVRHIGPTFGDLAKAYTNAKNFSENSEAHLFTRT